MSLSEHRLQDVAARVCEHDLPHGELTHSGNSLLDVHLNQRGGIPQERLAAAMRSFAAMTKLLLPETAVDDFVAESLRTQAFPYLFSNGVILKLAPGWAKDGPLKVVHADGTIDRKASLEKYTYEEVLRSCNLAVRCPDIPLAFQYAQHLIEQYLISLRSEIAKTDEAKASSLETFQYHWADAANFTRVFMMGLSLTLKEHDETAIDHIDQEVVDRMFSVLESTGAFEMNMPAMPFLNIPAQTFSCPARGFLKQFMTGGTFMRVVKKIHSLRRGESDMPFDVLLHEASRDILKQIASATRDVVLTGNKEAFLAFQQMGKSRFLQS